ncbi:MAG: triose-phosphate isomerase [Gammaproteobacteria bacterium]|nr:triose-phosphate isomerase [Gammaproteobacteria bacterium]MBU1415341.1 triose-phosphate isomerase [Gammaproteobacteria bacterium]
MSRPKFVAGNWKMYGSLPTNASLLSAVKSGSSSLKAQIAVCVPYPYLAQAQAELAGSNIAWGAQDMSEYDKGAYTGEVSGSMLTDFGCRYVIVGHSERRSYYGDTDAVVASKFAAALKVGLTPILCVGETLAERESDITDKVVIRQLDVVIATSGVESLTKAVVAYEPVWAIGTGKTASPAQAQEVHALIRSHVATANAGVAAGLQILYGGSVKPGNAKELFGQPDIDGGLIGGASLVADDFIGICAAA